MAIQNFLSDIHVGDDIYIRLGDRLDDNNNVVGDFYIRHTGANTWLTNSTGTIILKNNADDKGIAFMADDGNGSATTYFELEADQSTYDTTNSVIEALYTTWKDNSRIALGTSRDLLIFHDGANSYINEVGTGFLTIQSDAQIRLGSITGTEKYARFYKDGKVELFYNNSIKFETTDTGIKLPSYGAGYLKTDADGNVSVDTSTIEDTLQTVTDRGSTTTNTMQGTRLGLGGAPHASAALQITTTAQHLRMYNGSELGVIHVLSGGELELWAHGNDETINFRTGSGSGVLAAHIDGINTTFKGNALIEGTLSVWGNSTIGDNFGDAHTINGKVTNITNDAEGYSLSRRNGGTQLLISANGDSQVTFGTDDASGNNTDVWSIGKDNTDNSFRISSGGTLGTGDKFKLTTSLATFEGNVNLNSATGPIITLTDTDSSIGVDSIIGHIAFVGTEIGGETSRIASVSETTGGEAGLRFYTGSSVTQALQLNKDQNATFAGTIETTAVTVDSHAPGNAILTLQYDSNQDSPATVDNNDILGAIHFKGIDDSASSAVTGVYGKILATSDGLWDGSGNRGIDLSFHTGKYNGSSVATAAALTLDQNQNATFTGDVLLGSSKGLYTNLVQAVSSAGLKLGNDDNSQYIFIKDDTGVGIGTTSPSEKLHVNGGHLEVQNAGNTNIYINAQADSDATLWFQEGGGAKGKIQNDASNDSILITDGANADTMTLKGQKVGIGTTSPDQKLHVEFANTDTSFSGGSGGAWGGDGIRIENTSNTAGTMAMLHLRNKDADIHIAGIRRAADDSDLGFFFEGTQKVLFENDGSATFGGQVTVDSNWVSDEGSLSIVHDQNTLGGIGIVANSVYKGGLIQRDGTAGDFMELTTYTSQPLKLRTNNTDTVTIATNGETTIKRAVDGDFTGLRIMNQKTYGSGTGNNERPRLVLGIAESGAADSTREGFVLESLTPDETNSANINTILKTRASGSVGNHILLEGSNKHTTFYGDVRLPSSGKLYTWTGHDDNYLRYDLWRASASAGMTIHNISADGEIYLKSGNATALTLDSSQNATFEADISLADNKHINLGAGADLKLYSNGTDGYVVAPIDDLVLQGADDVFIYAAGGEDAIIARGDAAVEIFYNNSKKLETTSYGTLTTGRSIIDTTDNGLNVGVVPLEIGNDVGTTQSRDSWIKYRASSQTTDKTWAIGAQQGGEFRFNYLGTRATSPPDGTNLFKITNTGVTTFAKGITTGDNIVINNASTSATLGINATTHNTNAQSEAWLSLGYEHSGGSAYGEVKLTESTNNSFDGDMTFRLPYNNGSGGSSTRTIFTLDGSDKSGKLEGPLFLAGSAARISGTSGGELGLNYNTGSNQALVWYAGGTTPKFSVTNNGDGTFEGDVLINGGDLTVKDTGTENAYIRAYATGTGAAGLYIDAVNGDGAGSDYFSLRQLDNKSIEFNARTSTGVTVFYSKGSLNLTQDGANAQFAGNVDVDANLSVDGTFTSRGIDDNADATAITINGNEEVGIGGTPYAKLDVYGITSIRSDGGNADGAALYLRHANNNSTDVISTIFFGNNADTSLSAIVTETNGGNTTSNLKFKTSNAGTIGTALTLNADNSAAFADDVTITGDLTVNGTTTTVNQTNLDVADNIIGLNRGLTGANANDSGIIIERGSTGDNAAFLWDESADRFIFGTTTATAASTGDITYTAAPFGGKGLWTTTSAVTHWGVGPQSTAYGTLTWDTGYAKVHATGSNRELHLGSADDSDAVKISGSNVTIAGQVETKNNAGIYSFSDTVNASASENIFELENTHGAQAFRATFVCNTSSYSVAKTFEVVHMHGNTPVFAKVVDTGAFGGHDFTVAFTSVSGANDKVRCTITNASSSINANIVTTVFLGGSPTDITVTEL